MKNLDEATVKSFGDEWQRFDQTGLSPQELDAIFQDYFHVFPWSQLPDHATGFDMGCGTGRWAERVAPNVGKLYCLDPSAALAVARQKLARFPHVICLQASVAEHPLPPASMDFGYSLGVLHHVPDTTAAITQCAALLKPGAPLLLYLYYAFDDRPLWFKAVWKMSDVLRRLLCGLPPRLKGLCTDGLALGVYWPLARLSALLERWGMNVRNIPLSFYRNLSFYTMRTDARDRFGTPLEQRFTRAQLEAMLAQSGLVNPVFSDKAPYWCVVAWRSHNT